MVLKLTEEIERRPLMSLTDGTEPDHTDDFKDAQAARLHLALGEKSPGLDVVKPSVVSGNLEEYKRLLSDQEVIQKYQAQSDILETVLKSEPQAVTPEVIDVVQGLSMVDMKSQDLKGIIERNYAKLYTNTAAASLDNEILEESFESDPEATMDLLDRAETVAFKQSYAASALDEAKKAVESQGYLQTGWNFTENLFLGQYQQYGQVESDFTSAILPGADKEQQYAYLWGLQDSKEFQQTFDAVVDDLRSRNPYTLTQWLQGFFSYGNADATLDTTFAVVDAVGLVPAARLGKALKGVSRGVTKNPMKPHEIAKDLGRFDDAAVGKLVEDVREGTVFEAGIKNLRELGNSVPSIADPMKLLRGAQNVPQAAYTRLKEALLNRSDLMQRFLLEPNLVDRATPEELLQYKDVLRADYLKANPSIQKNIIDIEVSDTPDLGNVYQAKISFGMRDGTLFGSEKAAENYLKRWIKPTDDWDIVSAGGKPVSAPKPGFVRFYHGGSGDLGDASKLDDLWVTPDFEYAKNYRADSKTPNNVWYVDVPADDPAAMAARQWDELDEAGQTNMVGRYGNVKLPKQWAAKVKRYANQGQIVQEGSGFKIEITKPVDESRFFNDIRLGTTQRTPESLANSFGWGRSPNYVVSDQQGIQRSTLTTSREMMNDIYETLVEPFKKLSNSEVSELQDLMVDNQKAQKYFETYGDFEVAFQERFHKNPSLSQTDSYFAYVQLNDLDLVVRDLDWYKQKARLGLREINLRIEDKDLKFEGKVIDDLPYGSNDPFWVSVVKDGKASGPKFSKFVGEKDREAFAKLKAEGYKVVQVADQNFEIGDSSAGFLLVKDFKAGNLGVQNVGRKPGGHKIHKYPYYVKQGKIKAGTNGSFYRGDTTLWNFASPKEAEDFLSVLETARLKVLNREADAAKFIRDNLPMSVKDFMRATKDGTIDLNVPFAVTKSGQRTLDTGAYQSLKDLHDVTKSEHNLSQRVTGRFGGERSEADISLVRSEEDLKFHTQPAPVLSPLDALATSSRDMLNTRLVNDYSLSTRDNFIREFGDVLEGTREEQLASGMSILTDPIFKASADPKRVSYAKNVSRSYNNLLNYGTPLDHKIEAWKEKLIDSVAPSIKKFGPRGQQWVEDRMLSRVKDPGLFFRTAAFHMKLGMFNVTQYIKQANSVVNVVSIAGTNGLKSSALYPVIRATLNTSERKVLERGGKIAESLGLMKSKDFVESIDLLKKSGFQLIGGDVSYLDDLTTPEIRRSRVGQGFHTFLELGKTPFVEGERLARLAAWNSAYMEKRAALGTKALTRRDEADILRRAKVLIGNMTRESNAPWQKGYLGTVTQFFGYQARIMEQFLGKGLTKTEKARLFVGYSAAYGVPVALGATTGVIPVREVLMDYMNANGWDVNDPAAKPFMDGLASAALEMVFGQDYDIAGTLGAGGIPTFYDLYRGDSTISDLLLGASGGIMADTVMSTYPIVRGFASEYMDFEGGYYNLTPEDFLAPLRNISSVDSSAKLYNVWNFGVWASKNGTDITKMDLPDGIAAALTGVTPEAVGDSFSKYRAVKLNRERVDSLIKEFAKDYKQVLSIEDGKTRESMVKDIKARMILEGLTAREMAKAWQYGSSREMMTDVFFEQYDKLKQRKGW